MRSAQGLGSLSGALIIASLGRFQFKGRLLTIGSISLPIIMITLSVIRSLPVTLVLLAGLGMAVIFTNNLSNTLVQSIVPDDLRGRVMSIFSLTFFGFMPFGSFMMGQIAEASNETTAILVGGIVILIYSILLFLFVPQLRKLE
jgi:MFS-type transporter involved in bile tolerance (Atg22 family)